MRYERRLLFVILSYTAAFDMAESLLMRAGMVLFAEPHKSRMAHTSARNCSPADSD